MTLEQQRREAEDDTQRPSPRPPEARADAPRRLKPDEDAGGRPPLSVPRPRLRYASPDLQRAPEGELPRDRLTTLTRAALEALGGQQERALHFTPDEEVLTRLVNDEALDLTPRSDLTPMIPEEQSRGLSGAGRDEGKAFEEDYRREAELKPDDLEEIARERRDLVQAYYAQVGHALVEPAEVTQLVGPPQVNPPERGDPASGPQEGEPQPIEAAPQAPTLPQLLATEGGGRALQVVTQRLSEGFQRWLRQEGHWHKRSEWLKEHLSRSWEYAPDALSPHTLLLAPKGRGRFASFVQTAPADPDLQGDQLSEKERGSRKDEVKARTRASARNGQFERQIREARREVVLATTKTIVMSWAEARDPAWALDASTDDATAGLKSPQQRALDAWLNGGS